MNGPDGGASRETTVSPARSLGGLRSVHSVRLITGLILLLYVGSHLLNHALGNVSIAAMEAGLTVQIWIWHGLPGTIALYGALATHFSLGLWAFYARRHFGWTRAEVVQSALGLAIPFLLMNHLYATRIALLQFGLQKGYPQELYSFWVAAPSLGILQVAVLIVAWVHGCIGVYFWLRLKAFFDHAKPLLLCAAMLVPLLSLLGFYQGGQTVLALVNDAAWRQANLAAGQVGLPAENARLLLERNLSLGAVAALVLLVLVARGVRAVWERRGGIVRVTYPDGRIARIPAGLSVLDASRSAGIPHASVCGGRARCSTCRVRVIAGRDRLPQPNEPEQAILTRVGAAPHIRLACQLRPDSDIGVVPLQLPGWTAAAMRAQTEPRAGEERFIVVLVADMRDSARLAETRLPFDAVFIIDRFVNAIGSAVTEAGGRPNQFTGDGLIATFGLNCEPKQACRQAVDALGLIGRNMADLNRVLMAEMAEPIRFGIGVHGSSAVVGEIGYAESRVFTTLGDAANVANRLEQMCKEFGCEAVVSQPVFAMSDYAKVARGVSLGGGKVTIRGREATLAVYAIDAVVQLLGLLDQAPNQAPRRRPLDAAV